MCLLPRVISFFRADVFPLEEKINIRAKSGGFNIFQSANQYRFLNKFNFNT